LRDSLELFTRFDHVYLAVVVDEKYQSVRQDGGGVVLSEFFLPEDLAGCGLVTERHAGIADAEQVIAGYDQGRNVRGAPGIPPDDVGVRDIASAVGTYREDFPLWPTAADENQSGLFAVNRSRDEFLRRPVNFPYLLAGLQ